MESFLLFCNTVLIALVVALTIMDERRKHGARATSPFRPDDDVAERRAGAAAPSLGERHAARRLARRR